MPSVCETKYDGNGRCLVRSRDGKSTIAMDAPPSCGGNGENWSPGDWLGYAFAGCLIVSMDNAAKRQGFGMAGARVTTEVEMAESAHKVMRLRQLRAVVHPAQHLTEPQVALLHKAAKMCPIHNSISSECKVVVEVENG